MNNDLMFSSENQKWQTRDEYFKPWLKRFGFTLDVCASEGDQKLDKYFTPEQDGLAQDWTQDIFWCNPPYGREQRDWVAHGFYQGASGVFLIPSRTDTVLFHDEIILGVKHGYCEVEFLRGRLTFGSNDYWYWVWEQPELNGKVNSLYKKYGKMNPAPFPSMLVKCGDCKDL